MMIILSLRKVIKQIVNIPNIKIVAEASSGMKALELVWKNKRRTKIY